MKLKVKTIFILLCFFLIFLSISDFIVNEIDSRGKVVRLTNFELPIDLNKIAQDEKLKIENLEENVLVLS